MTTLRQLLFTHRLSHSEILRQANSRMKKRVHQSRFSRIVNGKLAATEYEKNRIRLALERLGVDERKVLKVRELAAKARAA